MTTKTTQKKYGFTLDEEKDVFLASVNKKIRNARKKIEAIDDLAKRDKDTLKAEQIEKINSRGEVNESIRAQESLRDLYYAAYKTAKEEGKWQPGTETTSGISSRQPNEEGKTSEPVSAQQTTPAASQAQTQTQPQAQPAQSEVQAQSAEDKQAEHAKVSRDSLSKILNLVHFVQFFRDQSRVQAWRQAQGSSQNVNDLEAFADFYTKVLTFSDSDKLGKVGDKLNSSLGELEAYVNGAEEPALRNRTYKSLQETVENIVGSSFFQSHSANVGVAPANNPLTELNAIGSELKRGHEHQQKLDVPAEAEQLVPNVGSTQSKPPVKENKSELKSHEQPTKPAETQNEQDNKKDWIAVEDEEEEEEDQGENEGQNGEEQKQAGTPDDEWSTVKTKAKPKKEENTGGYRGGRGGYRGGYRGDGNRGGRGGYRGGEGRGGERGGYRGGRDNRDQQEGQQGEGAAEGGEQVQGQGQTEGGVEGENRGGYRGGRGGYRGGEGRGGYRGGYRGGEGGEGEGRGGYRGGYRGGDGEGRGGYRGGYRGGEGGEGEGRGGYRGGRGGYRGGEGGEGGEGGYRGGRGGYRGGEGRGGYRGGQGRGSQGGFERRQDNEGARPTTTEAQNNA